MLERIIRAPGVPSVRGRCETSSPLPPPSPPASPQGEVSLVVKGAEYETGHQQECGGRRVRVVEAYQSVARLIKEEPLCPPVTHGAPECGGASQKIKDSTDEWKSADGVQKASYTALGL
jgi:hypothetical protein